MKDLVKENSDLKELKVSDIFDISESENGIILRMKKHVILDMGNNHMIMKGDSVGVLDFKILHFNPFYKNRDKYNKLENPNEIINKAEELRKPKTSKLNSISKMINKVYNKLKWRSHG